MLNEVVPVGSPDNLNDIPAGATEDRFQFLDDFAVPAYRAVKPLQVAVDDEDQVVELFTGRESDGAERFGFFLFAVAQEAPDFPADRLLQPAIFEILDEPCVIDRLDRAQSHRHRGKLPEIGHQPRMRIGRQSSTWLQLATEVLQLLLGYTALEIRAGINSRGGMALKINNVAVTVFGLGAEEVIEGDFVQRGGGGEGRNMSADTFLDLIGAHDHGQGVPADKALNTPFHFLTAGKRSLVLRRNGVLVRRSRCKR